MTDPLASLQALGAALSRAAPAVHADVLALRALNPDAPTADDPHVAEWHAYYRALENRPHHGAPRNVGARWWCRWCSAFVSSETAPCAKCRDHGPHAWGEDAPTTGNAQRRARLRATHKRRNRGKQ